MGFVDWSAARFERTCASVARLLDEHPVAAWGLFSLFYFGAAAWRASRKAFWFDELVTLHVCRLPSMSQVWAAFEEGADAMPPLLHLLTRASIWVFGEGHISARVPAMLGIWLTCLCLYLFVRRHCPAVYGWVAASTMALFMGLSTYSEEARSYGLLMGFTGLALLCWQSATGRRRRLWLCGLASSVAAAIFSHSMAVMVVAVLGLGELARAYLRRKLDWPVLAALLVGGSVILFLVPGGMASAAAYSASHWARPDLIRIPGAYRFLFEPLALPLSIALVLAGVWWSLRAPNRPAPAEPPVWRMPAAEAAMAVALLLLPVLTGMVAFITGIFTARYTLPALTGFSIMGAYLSRSVERAGRTLAVVVVAVFLLGWLALDTARRPPLWEAAPVSEWAGASRLHGELPIVVDGPLTFLQKAHYAPEDVAPRLVFLADAARAYRAFAGGSATTGLVLLARWAPLRVEQPEAFLARHRRFYLMGTDWLEAWLRGELLESRASVRLVGAGNYGELYLVETDR